MKYLVTAALFFWLGVFGQEYVMRTMYIVLTPAEYAADVQIYTLYGLHKGELDQAPYETLKTMKGFCEIIIENPVCVEMADRLKNL